MEPQAGQRALSRTQVDHYREHGYVVVPGALEPAEVERILGRARAIAHGAHPPEAADRLVRDIHFAKGLLPAPADPEHALWKLLNPDRFDPVLAECLRLPRVLDAVECLLGPDLLSFLLMLIYKPPGVPQSVHPFHQDALYFPFGPHDDVLGVWIPLDPVDADNGSLCVLPGSQRGEVERHEALPGVNGGAFAVRRAETSEKTLRRAVTFTLAPGDCVLFHSRLLHRTGGNATPRHRRVLTLHVASARCSSETPIFEEFGFHSVRGRTYPGCLQPVERPGLSLARGGQR